MPAGNNTVGSLLVFPVTVLLLAILVLVPAAYADGEDDYEKYDNDEYEGQLGDLGEAALYGGIVTAGGYVAFKHAFVRARRVMRFDPRILRYALDIHSVGGIVFGAAAAAHGFANIEQAGPIEYAMALLILILTASGAVMRYSLNKRARRTARLIHSQRVLALTLLVLALIHASLMD